MNLMKAWKTVQKVVDDARVEVTYRVRVNYPKVRRRARGVQEALGVAVIGEVDEVIEKARRFERKIHRVRARYAAMAAVQRIYKRPNSVAQNAYRARFGYAPWEGGEYVNRLVDIKRLALLRGERLRMVLKALYH